MTDMPQPDLEVAIDRHPVESSNIASVGYHQPTGTLEVEFTSGAVYRYGGVPAATAWPLLPDLSMGGYFSSAIKGGGFKHERIDR